MGLIQREIERRGIPTVGISIVRRYTEKVKPPRTVHVKWPFGHPLGEPGNVNQQTAVLMRALEAAVSMDTPGTILDLPLKWRRETYGPPPWSAGRRQE